MKFEFTGIHWNSLEFTGMSKIGVFWKKAWLPPVKRHFLAISL